LLKAKRLAALPLTKFGIDELPKALRFMSRAAHVGKITVRMDGVTVPAAPPPRVALDAVGAHLITGGASGFGLRLAEWAADRGARTLVLVSRSGPKRDEDRARIAALQAAGVTVHLAMADMANAGAVNELIARFGADLPPLSGVIHAAAVLNDQQMRNMGADTFMQVFAPKALGAWHLDRAMAARGVRPDYTLLLSSISSVIGLSGQANYAAANLVLDRLAKQRSRRGKPTTSVNLGVLGDYAGMSRPEDDVHGVLDLLESHGMPPMPLADVLAKVEAALAQRTPSRMTASIGWRAFLMANPHLSTDTRFVQASALEGSGERRAGDLRGTLAALDDAATKDMGELWPSACRTIDHHRYDLPFRAVHLVTPAGCQPGESGMGSVTTSVSEALP
jgi:NAD(P)-dependent dehydrogenase (short-subunit alcohol dehydrogenase family)